MRKLSKKQSFERITRFADWVYVLGLSCPCCASNQVLVQKKDWKIVLGDDTTLACWDCLSQTTVGESLWWMRDWRRDRVPDSSNSPAEKQVTGDKPCQVGENGGPKGPVLDIPAHGMTTDDAVQGEDIPQAEKVQKGKKADRKRERYIV